MIIFQTAGYGYAGSFAFKAGLLNEAPQVTTFRSNDYIHRLNRALQAEVRALSAYVRLSAHGSGDGAYDEGLAGHHQASRELVRLVVASRGVPEDRSALSLGLTRRLVALFSRMPAGLAERATLATLRQLERQLPPHYAQLLLLAPPRDLDTLRELMEQAQRQELTIANLLKTTI